MSLAYKDGEVAAEVDKRTYFFIYFWSPIHGLHLITKSIAVNRGRAGVIRSKA